MTDDQQLQRTEKLRASADEAARHVRNVGLTFLLVAVYVAILVGSTTDEQLLRGSEVPLPVLNVGLPIFVVYLAVPGLFLILHFNLLIQLHLLARKVHGFDRSLEQLPGENKTFQRDLLFPFVLSHMLAGKQHSGLIRSLLHVMVWIPVFIVPTVLLIMVQIQFLPYHSEDMTWWHRSTVLIDQVMLVYFVPKILFPEKRWRVWSSGSKPEDKRGRGFATLGLFVFVPIFLIYFLIAVVPGGWIERNTDWPIVADYVFDPLRDFFDRKFGRNLDLRQRTLVSETPPPELLAEYERSGKGIEAAWLAHAKGLDLQDRDLRSANFFNARLTGANLRGARLQDANLDGARLQGADLVDAKLQGAFLGGAYLQSATLDEAYLQGVNLVNADLRSAKLRHAKLQGADLQGAQLQGAFGVQIQGSALVFIELQGTALKGAELNGADLRGARLGWSDLTDVDLTLTDLRGVNCEILDEQQWDDFVASVRDSVPEGDRKARALNRIKAARERANPCDEIDPKQASGAIYEKEGRFADWPEPPDKEAYDRNLAFYLAELSCSDEYIVRGIARRVRAPDLFDEDRHLYPLLARKLLADECTAGQQLPEDVRAELQEIAKLAATPVE